MKRTLAILTVLLLSVGAFAQQMPNYELASQFSQKKISQMVFSTQITPNWFKDSNKFWYSWRTPDGPHYYIVDPVTGKKEEVFDMEKLAMEITLATRDPFDAQHIPFQKLELKDDKVFRFDIKSTMEVPDTTAKKDTTKKEKPKMVKKVFHFEYDIASKTLKEYKPEEQKYPRWANMSPDGQIGVFAKNRDLYWMDAENLAKAAKDEKDSTIVEHRLTTDAKENFSFVTSSYSGDGVVDSTARAGVYNLAWSPDSKHFAAVKTDVRMLKELWVINSTAQPRPTLQTYKYQMPGEPGPKEYLYVFDITDGSSREIKVSNFKDQSLSLCTTPRKNADRYKDYRTTEWLGDNNGFYITRTSRDIKRLDLCRCDITADSAKTVVAERMNTYVEERQVRLLKNGSQLIWWSERNGWANLYLYNSDGTLVRNLTEGAYHVDDVVAVNEKEGYVLYGACGYNKGENPYHKHTFRVALAGGAPQMLDFDDTNVDASASDDGKFAVVNYSRVDTEPACAVISAIGKKTALEVADLSKLYEAGYKMPERFTVKAADGITDLYGVMYKPFDFDPTKTYPIIEYVYPGPQVEANYISWSRGMLRTDRLAQIGFIVITVGNRGGHPDRSKWYHNYGYGNLRDYGLEDQKTAVQRLAAKYSWIDGTRVGIHGHSGGGFMSTAAILKYPDFYKAAVSCAGNHDNRIYNRWWSEQHHGITEKIEQADTSFIYKISTNPEIAANLKGHLMLVHGDVDDNVHPANSIRVVDALIRANKRFDMLILPGQDHGFGDMNEYFFYRLADYFSEWLLGDSDRSATDIRQMNND